MMSRKGVYRRLRKNGFKFYSVSQTWRKPDLIDPKVTWIVLDWELRQKWWWDDFSMHRWDENLCEVKPVKPNFIMANIDHSGFNRIQMMIDDKIRKSFGVFINAKDTL